MSISTKHRSNEPEMMDNFSMEGETLQDALDKIADINRILGGNKVTLNGVKQLLKHGPGRKKEIRILDIGCGNGDMLRFLADYALKHQLSFTLTGLDANDFTIAYARELSEDYPNISYLCADIFDKIKQESSYDVILCTLTLHHFKDKEIIELLKAFKNKARMGIVINDLHRSALAYYLFTALCVVFGLNKMSKDDGLVSILRGFKRNDLVQYSNKCGFKNYTIRWKWAFRYQWIIPMI